MPKKMGRPTVPKTKAKTILRGAMFAPEEIKTIDRAIEDSGKDKSKWLRDAAMKEARARVVWFHSDIVNPGMHEKLIEYRLPFPMEDGRTMIREGVGQLVVRKNHRKQ